MLWGIFCVWLTGVEQKKEIITSLKRKPEDQQLSSTQNILTEALSSSTPELNVVLPNLESLARVTQRARAKSSRPANHPEALTSAEFELPPTCQKTNPSWPTMAEQILYLVSSSLLDETSTLLLITQAGSLMRPST